MGISQFLTVAANTASGNPEPSVGVVVATGLILVFGVLVLLYLLITLEGIIFTSVDRRKKGAPAPSPPGKTGTVGSGDSASGNGKDGDRLPVGTSGGGG